MKERKRPWGPFRIYQLISTANSAQFPSKISPSQGVEYIRDIQNIRSSKRIEANTEIQSSNMFRSQILSIRKSSNQIEYQMLRIFWTTYSEQRTSTRNS